MFLHGKSREGGYRKVQNVYSTASCWIHSLAPKFELAKRSALKSLVRVSNSVFVVRLVRRARRAPGADGDDEKSNVAQVARPKAPKPVRKLPKRYHWHLSPRSRPEVKPPRNASFATLAAFDSNNAKETDTLRKYCWSLKLVWECCPKAWAVMERAGFQEPGQYEVNNQYGGKIFGLPREVPTVRRFGEDQAGMVIRECLLANFSESQTEGVSKLLSFVYQLQNKGVVDNYRTVRPQMNRWRKQGKYGAPKQTVKAKWVIEPEDLRRAMTKEWSPESSFPLHAWSIAYMVVYHWTLNGCRPKVDLGKVKDSLVHVVVPSQGILWTDMGYRAKDGAELARKWKAFSVCMCPEQKHQNPCLDWLDRAKRGERMPFCTTCPLTCHQLIQSLLTEVDDHRIFPAMNAKFTFFKPRKEYRSMSPESMLKLAKDWLNEQGGNPDGLNYDTNMGRYALGKLCDVMSIPYEESFESHGNKPSNWARYQQSVVVPGASFTRRTQSPNVETATKSLNRIARWFGRGKTTRQDPAVVSTSMHGKLLAFDLRRRGHGAYVNAVLDGLV